MLESRSGRAINNGAILKLGAYYSTINLEKWGTVCIPKRGSKYAQNIQGLKTRVLEVPNMRDERQFAVKDKTQKMGFCLKRSGLLVKREGRHRKQPTETGKVRTHRLGGGEMKAILVSPRTQAKNSPI